MATDTPAKPTLAAQRADANPEAAGPAKPEAAAPAKLKPAAAQAPKRAATKRAASAKRAATKRATDARAAPKATAASKTAPADPEPDRNRAAVLSVLDAQERAANAFADYHARAAELSRIPGATTLANAQADLLRHVTVAYVTDARDLLK